MTQLQELKALAQDLRNERRDFQRKADYAQACLNEVQRKMAMLKLEAQMDTPMADIYGGWLPSLSNTNFTPLPMYSVTLKRSEWECYIDTPDNVIETINGYMSSILTFESDAIEAQRKAYEFLDLFKEWGFSDSEPSQSITDVINKRFKTTIDRWECMKASWGVTVWELSPRGWPGTLSRVY